MKNTIINYWQQLTKREQMILSWGGLSVTLILFYALIWQPWHAAIAHMEEAIQHRREGLVWMRQQADMIKDSGLTQNVRATKSADQSLLSVIEKSARANRVSKSIQQMVPGTDAQTNVEQVNVVLEEADFNQWVRWVDSLYRDYAVNIKQLTVDNETDQPNIVELRVTFQRG